MNKNKILSIIRTENQISLDFISYSHFIGCDDKTIEILKNDTVLISKIIEDYRLSWNKISLNQFILKKLKEL
mgnify:CR=1 FL=1